MNEARAKAEELMEKYEQLKLVGYLIETRDKARIVVMRDWRLVGYTHTFEEAVMMCAEDMLFFHREEDEE